MKVHCFLYISILIAHATAASFGQGIQVGASKHASTIPEICKSAVPAVIEGSIDTATLVKEAECKGAGDVMNDFSYVLKYEKRDAEKKKGVKEESKVFEVFIPTLKDGTRARGILLMTIHNGVAVPPDELEKERKHAADLLEKEEKKSAATTVAASVPKDDENKGMHPLGTYSSVKSVAGKILLGRDSAVLFIPTYLKTCNLRLVRREVIESREVLIFNFEPIAGAIHEDNESYISQLEGTVWIDAQDRIVTRLAGWPNGSERSGGTDKTSGDSGTTIDQALLHAGKPPAVYQEMIRLPEGIWLPLTTRINGFDYPEFFGGINFDARITYSDFHRFKTNVTDVKLDAPSTPTRP